MITITKLTGYFLIVLGFAAYLLTDGSSITSLIPSFVGTPIACAGLIAKRESLRPHAMHAAMLVALIGALGSLMNVAQIGSLINGSAERPAAIIVSTIMFVVLAAYLAVGIKSFRKARQNRVASAR